ncbi:hypothetical protein ZHAS_00015835 [Anopheles sinensis]|uniref:Uncharacterized protein n=1 Tax=Anopheles sinensis TaxID=74873 RepID=A0A084WC21_ANOSI|nr:hypothetical protein ZHAS_00015835 [Anopheles sinensis]
MPRFPEADIDCGGEGTELEILYLRPGVDALRTVVTGREASIFDDPLPQDAVKAASIGHVVSPGRERGRNGRLGKWFGIGIFAGNEQHGQKLTPATRVSKSLNF